MKWIEEENKSTKSLNQILTFSEYMDKFNENPYRETRPTFQYLMDMINYYCKKERSHKLFHMDHPDAPPIYGQDKILDSIYGNLQTFKEEGFNNKFLLLVGPNGSSKSSIVRKLMKGAEEYSRIDEGPLYTFSWIFPIESYIKGTLGLSEKIKVDKPESYAHLDDKDVSAIIPTELKDHPILLIPRDHRQKILDNALDDINEHKNIISKSYLYRGDISKRNRMIYDALLKSYKGDHAQVLKHIRVERYTISKRYSIGAVTIEPQLHVDAHLQQITMDKRLGSLPPSLQSLNLFSLQGEAVLANRGLLEYSDLLKRPLDAFKYLLMTMETKNINLQGILTELDIFFIGTSNEIHLEAFKQHPDFKSFKGRFNFITVPYLLDYNEEVKIYKDQVNGLSHKVIFEPHSIKLLCIFAIMTRLRQSTPSNYGTDSKLSQITASLTPLEKAIFIATEESPERLDVESVQILKHNYTKVKNEYSYELAYEGRFGISPREIKKIIYKLASQQSNITFIEIIERLEKFILKKNDYDFLNMQQQGDYHNFPRFIELIKEHSLNIFDSELRRSLGLVDERSYEDYIKRYIQNINAMLKGEKIKNEITGKYETTDDYFIKEFESSIDLDEDVENFRSYLISKLGAYSLDNPEISIIYKNVFPTLVKKLQESFKEEQNKVIQMIANNIVFYEKEQSNSESGKQKIDTPMSEEHKKVLDGVVLSLSTKHNYSTKGSIKCIKFLIDNRY